MNNKYQEVDMDSNMDQQQPINDINNATNYNVDNSAINNDLNTVNNNLNNLNNNYTELNNDNQYYDPNVNTYDPNLNGVDNNTYQTTEEYNTYNNTDNAFDSGERKSLWAMLKWPLIIVGIIIIIVIIFFLIRGCASSSTPVDPDTRYTTEYNLLTEASKRYFESHPDEEPLAYGECTEITLKDLTDEGIITSSTNENLNTCSEDNTTIKACKLSSGNIHYTVNFSCTSSNLNISYNDWSQGSESNLTDTSDVRFLFLAQEVTTSEGVSGSEEEIWKDEITYPEDSYIVISTKTYYRSRNAIWKWVKNTDYYYPGDIVNVNNATTYYKTAPNSEYSKQGAAATAYKWYVNSHEKYPTYSSTQPNASYSVKGLEGTPVVSASTDVPSPESYRTIKSNQTIYRTRTLSKTETLTKAEYRCTNGVEFAESNTPCTSNPEMVDAGLTTTSSYKCYYDNSTIPADGWQTNKCRDKIYSYNDWNKWTNVACTVGTEPKLCESTTGYVYTDRVWEWFTPSTKTYYPSGSTSESGESAYYVNSPVANAIKDSSTETTVYKWYKTITQEYDASTTSPDPDAVKTNQGWSSWSDYTLTKPASSSSRQIEERELVTLSREATSGDVKVTDITNGYVSLADMLDAVKAKGYEVNSLEDILNISNLSYRVRLYYRNTK